MNYHALFGYPEIDPAQFEARPHTDWIPTPTDPDPTGRHAAARSYIANLYGCDAPTTEKDEKSATAAAMKRRFALPDRLSGLGSPEAIFSVMAENDAEAFSVLVEYVEYLTKKNNGYPPMSMLFALDAERVYGKRITALYTSVCKEDVAKFARAIDARVCDAITQLAFNIAIDSGVELMF